MINLILASPKPPASPQAIAFFDGQNLFRSAKRAFAYIYPNYDPKKLSQKICINQGWELKETRFYTGFRNLREDIFWNQFWRGKFAQLKRDSVHVFSRDLRYQNEQVTLPTGQIYTIRTTREKGVDVKIAVDIIRLAHRRIYDVALVFSQDQDFSESRRKSASLLRNKTPGLKLHLLFLVLHLPIIVG